MNFVENSPKLGGQKKERKESIQNLYSYRVVCGWVPKVFCSVVISQGKQVNLLVAIQLNKTSQPKHSRQQRLSKKSGTASPHTSSLEDFPPQQFGLLVSGYGSLTLFLLKQVMVKGQVSINHTEMSDMVV